MAKEFDEDGVRFQYPESWELEHEETEAGWTATLNSPATAFMIVSLHGDVDDPARLADHVLETLREDYPDLDAESCVETLAGQPAVGYDVNFISLDLTNTCWIRCIAAGGGSLLVLCQCTDRDLATYGPALRAVCASLRVEDEG